MLCGIFVKQMNKCDATYVHKLKGSLHLINLSQLKKAPWIIKRNLFIPFDVHCTSLSIDTKYEQWRQKNFITIITLTTFNQ